MERFQSINDIRNKIAEKDEKLAGLFDDIIRNVVKENERSQEFDDIYPEIHKPRKAIIEDLLYPNRGYGAINVIPGENKTSCHSYCVCFAFDKWQYSKGFCGIARKAIDYWLSCAKINRGTLIFSYAWDDVDFSDKYKRPFDHYTNEDQHTVAVILISSRGISLQYLN